MAPPLPPKPKIGPLVRRSLFVAALGGAGCSSHKPQPSRIGPPPPRIGAEEIYEPGPAPDAAAPDGAEPIKAPPRIGPPPPPPRIGPPVRPERIGPPPPPTSSLIRGEVIDSSGAPVALASLRVELGSGTRIVATDREGRFVLDGLPAGEHAATISSAGYASVELTLEPGSMSIVLHG